MDVTKDDMDTINGTAIVTMMIVTSSYSLGNRACKSDTSTANGEDKSSTEHGLSVRCRGR